MISGGYRARFSRACAQRLVFQLPHSVLCTYVFYTCIHVYMLELETRAKVVAFPVQAWPLATIVCKLCHYKSCFSSYSSRPK